MRKFLSKFSGRYGIQTVKKWKLETWNEPDLRQYNTLNFTFNDYEDYVNGLREGLDKVGRRNHNFKFLLRGPAGLFKSNKTHHLCWGILDTCNSNQSTCPLDILSYHRKGLGKAKDVINESLELINNISIKFPNLKKMRIANSEADPTTGWSKPLAMNSDVEYAVVLVNIVLLHWNAKYSNNLPSLSSISHDNAFISYHPYEFYQRTLLAHFQLNNTNPIETQFIQKPVYAALGMLSNLAAYAGALNNNSGSSVISLWSHSNDTFYFCGIISSETKSINTEFRKIHVHIDSHKSIVGGRILSLIEYLESDITDPVHVWKSIGQPAYPNSTQRQMMRTSQGPYILSSPVDIRRNNNSLSMELNATLKSPWLLSIRICSEFLRIPDQVKNLRIRRVNDNEVILFWKENFTKSRCTKTYEIYFLPYTENGKSDWINIAIGQHVPLMCYYFAPDFKMNLTTRGQYKVRGVDVFERKGKFSLIKTFN